MLDFSDPGSVFGQHTDFAYTLYFQH